MLHRLNWEKTPVRLIGIGLHGLTTEISLQGDLFGDGRTQVRPRLERVLDQVHDRFGGSSIERAASMLRPINNSASWEAPAWERSRTTSNVDTEGDQR